MFTCSKIYRDIPFAHRQHEHEGHCRFIHGHNWSFEFLFAGVRLEGGFLYDFGKLKWLKEWIDLSFDHALVLNANDPEIGFFRSQFEPDPTYRSMIRQLAKITVVPSCSCEGLAKYLFDTVAEKIQLETRKRVRLIKVIVREDSKNSASYSP